MTREEGYVASSDALRMRSDFQAADAYRVVQTVEALADRYDIPVSDWVKLNQNENSFGALPAAADAVASVSLHRYPDSTSARLREALAGYCGVSADRIVAGNGGDEIIDVLFRLFIDPGDEVINCPPTFGFYPVAAKLNRARLIAAPRDHRFAIDPAAISQAVGPRTKMILVCSPNNPTGNLTRNEDLIRVLELGVPVMVDEAYAEFSGYSALVLQNEYPHLMLIRTFSKWAGLAGLRVGYGIFSHEIARHVHTIRPAYTVNAAAEAAAIASISSRGELLAVVDRVRKLTEALRKELARFGWLSSWPSDANFVYCQAAGSATIGWIYEELLKQGVLVRLFANPDAIRITVGTERENALLIEALTSIGRSIREEGPRSQIQEECFT